jgi:hypothetical protein
VRCGFGSQEALNTTGRSQLRLVTPLYDPVRVDSCLVDTLERYVRAGLELAGDETDDVDLAVIRVADAVYGPALAALDAADLSGVQPEPDLDPARPPRPL